MTALTEVVAAHQIRPYGFCYCGAEKSLRGDGRSGKEWHADHLAAAVTAWIGERLSGARDDVAEGLNNSGRPWRHAGAAERGDCREAADAALAVVAAALGVEVGSGSTGGLRGAETGAGEWYIASCHGDHSMGIAYTYAADEEQNAAFIAATSPDVVLALLDEVAALRAKVARVEALARVVARIRHSGRFDDELVLGWLDAFVGDLTAALDGSNDDRGAEG